MKRLEDKVVIITGAAGGQGESHARVVAREGAKVVVTDIDSDRGQKVADDIGENALFIKHDVTSEENWNDVVKQTLEKFGKIDGLVNNAGAVEEMGPVENLPLDVFRKIIDLNLTGTFLGIKAVIPEMKEAKYGSIVNISSQAGVQGNPFGAAYGSAKFGVTGLTKIVALEVAPMNIRVNSVHPGVIVTPFFGDEPETADQFIDAIPSKKFQTVEEISNMVLFLLSDESSGSTGSPFFVDGGMNA